MLGPGGSAASVAGIGEVGKGDTSVADREGEVNVAANLGDTLVDGLDDGEGAVVNVGDTMMAEGVD